MVALANENGQSMKVSHAPLYVMEMGPEAMRLRSRLGRALKAAMVRTVLVKWWCWVVVVR